MTPNGMDTNDFNTNLYYIKHAPTKICMKSTFPLSLSVTANRTPDVLLTIHSWFELY
jgi:hypothetical protein